MKFKEFVSWCNDRACDGCWSMEIAIYCLNVMARVRQKPLMKREKEWQKINEEEKVFENVVSAINARNKEVYGVQL